VIVFFSCGIIVIPGRFHQTNQWVILRVHPDRVGLGGYFGRISSAQEVEEERQAVRDEWEDRMRRIEQIYIVVRDSAAGQREGPAKTDRALSNALAASPEYVCHARSMFAKVGRHTFSADQPPMAAGWRPCKYVCQLAHDIDASAMAPH
jgi:hypothetical protein